MEQGKSKRTGGLRKLAIASIVLAVAIAAGCSKKDNEQPPANNGQNTVEQGNANNGGEAPSANTGTEQGLEVAELAALSEAEIKALFDEAAVPGNGEGTVVATFKGGTVTDVEFGKYTGFFALMDPSIDLYLSMPEIKQQILQEYVGYKVMYVLAAASSKESIKESVAGFTAELQNAIATQADLKAVMDEKAITVDESAFFYGIIITGMADAEAKVTDQEVAEAFATAGNDYDVVSVRHVLVQTVNPQTGEEVRTEEEALARAQEVKAELAGGGDWATIAAEYSDDGGSKNNGGLYEDKRAGEWVAEFKNAALTQPVGELGEPVLSQFGYHVMQVEKREAKTLDTLSEEDKISLKQNISGQKLGDTLTALMEQLNVELSLPAEAPPEAPADSSTESPANDTPAEQPAAE